jgi:hypothetical protein
MEKTMDKEKSHRWMLYVGLGLLAVGIALDLLWTSRQPSWIVYLINLLPGIQLLGSWRLATRQTEERSGMARLGIPLTVTALTFAVFINVVVDYATSFISDISRYPEMVAEFHDPALVVHFPAEVPDEARGASFFAVSGIFRRVRVLQLRCQMPADQIDELLADYQSEAVYSYAGGDASVHFDQSDGVPTTYFYTGNAESYAFPDSYLVLVLDAQPDKITADGFWQHGYSRGVAISEAESDIVYWLEEW